MSLPGSSWLLLLTLAVVTERSLPGFKVLSDQVTAGFKLIGTADFSGCD